MWEPEDWFMAFLVGLFILLSLLYMWADTTHSKQYEATCTKAGGTPYSMENFENVLV